MAARMDRGGCLKTIQHMLSTKKNTVLVIYRDVEIGPVPKLDRASFMYIIKS